MLSALRQVVLQTQAGEVQLCRYIADYKQILLNRGLAPLWETFMLVLATELTSGGSEYTTTVNGCALEGSYPGSGASSFWI
jgi:hypothetical protein